MRRVAAAALVLAACGGGADGGHPPMTKQVSVSTVGGVPEVGVNVYHSDASGAVQDIVLTDATGTATVNVAPGDAITARMNDDGSIGRPPTPITVIGFDDVDTVHLGGAPRTRTPSGTTTISLANLDQAVRVFVTTSCDATTLGAQQPSASFAWYAQCESANRVVIGVTDETTPRYATANAPATGPVVLDTWQPLQAVNITVPAGLAPIELAVELHDGAHGLRRFFAEGGPTDFDAAPLGTWLAQADMRDPLTGIEYLWFARTAPIAHYGIVAADLAGVDQLTVQTVGSNNTVTHELDGAAAVRRTDLYFGDHCSGGLQWVVVDDATASKTILPHLDPGDPTSDRLTATVVTTLTGTGVDLTAAVSAMAADGVPLTIGELAGDARPVGVTLDRFNLLPCD